MGFKDKLLSGVDPVKQAEAKFLAAEIGKELREALEEDRRIRRDEAFEDRAFARRNN